MAQVSRSHLIDRVHVIGSDELHVSVSWSVDVDDMARSTERRATKIIVGGSCDNSLMSWRIDQRRARRLAEALNAAADEMDEATA